MFLHASPLGRETIALLWGQWPDVKLFDSLLSRFKNGFRPLCISLQLGQPVVLRTELGSKLSRFLPVIKRNSRDPNCRKGDEENDQCCRTHGKSPSVSPAGRLP